MSYIVPEGVPKLIELGKDMRSAYQDLVERRQVIYRKTRYFDQQGLYTVQNLDILRSESVFLLNTLLRVSRQGIGSFVSFALTIINSEVVVRELLGPADLSGGQTLCVHEPAEVVMVGEYEHFMLGAF